MPHSQSSNQIVKALHTAEHNAANEGRIGGESATHESEYTAIDLGGHVTDSLLDEGTSSDIRETARPANSYQTLIANLFKWGAFDAPADLLLMAGFIVFANITGLLSKIEDNDVASSLLLFTMLGYVAALSIIKATIELFNPNKLFPSQAVGAHFVAGLVGFLVGSWGLFELRDDSFNGDDISVALSIFMTSLTYSATYNTCKLDVNERKESSGITETEQHSPLLTPTPTNAAEPKRSWCVIS